MGVARSRSHRAGGMPSIRTRRPLPHAVRVAVAAEARGGTAPGSTHLFLGVTRLTPWSSNRCGRRALLPRRDCGASALLQGLRSSLLPRSRDCDVLGALAIRDFASGIRDAEISQFSYQDFTAMVPIFHSYSPKISLRGCETLVE